MSANNVLVIIGRVGKDPETRQAGQHTVCEFSLAVNRPIKDKQGNSVADWFKCTLWGKQGELAYELVRKGALISVAGSCHIDECTDRDGNKQKMVKCAADGFQLLESKGDREAQPDTARSRATVRPVDPQLDEDDIPPF